MEKETALSRRSFLAATLAGATLCGVTSRGVAAPDTEVCVTLGPEADEAQTQTEETTVRPADTHEEKVGEITGSGDPVGIDGEYVSDIYIAEQDRFDYSFWRGVATVGPHENERGRIWLAAEFMTETASLLAHERGHNLGFRHTGGFMLPDNPDMYADVGLDEESVETAAHTDGLHICDWGGDNGTESLRMIINDWREGIVSTDELRYAINRWREGGTRDIYADDTFVTELGDLMEYDDEERTIRAEAIYRPEHSERYEAWEAQRSSE